MLDRHIKALLPKGIEEQDDDTQRRARLVISFSIAIFACGPMYGLVYGLLRMPVSALGAAVAAVVLAATPFVQRRTRSVSLGAHMASFGSYAALALVTAPSGGLAAPAVAWLALIPVTALMLGGRRIGFIWSLIAAATVAVYFGTDLLGLTPKSEVPSAWLPTLRFSVNVGLVSIIALLAWMYESTKDRMLAELKSRNDAVARAKDEAEDAHRGGRLVLDHVGEGLLVVDRNGLVAEQRSRALASMLNLDANKGDHVWDLFAESPNFAGALELGWLALFENILPFKLSLGQLPRTCRIADKTLALEFVPIVADANAPTTTEDADDSLPEKILVVVTDITADVRARDVAARQAEQIEVFKWIVRDRGFFADFYREAGGLVASLGEEAEGDLDVVDRATKLRVLHTLKGNASLFGLSSFASACHSIEERVLDRSEGAFVTAADAAAVSEAWTLAQRVVDPMLGPTDDDRSIVIRRDEYDALLKQLAKGEIRDRVESWSWEPLDAHLNRLAEQARSLSMRLHDRAIDVVVDSDGTRLPPDGSWTSFWVASAHVIRNAIDHGIEPIEEREAAGKPPQGKLALRARTLDNDVVVLDVRDDGRGVDWETVRAKATERGLPAETEKDLELALFADGLSTREESTETSGRGVGMSAVLATCRSLGGKVEVRSAKGEGTEIRFVMPRMAKAA
jgi:two-component system, chemotaxis family, sensor kinase CheA